MELVDASRFVGLDGANPEPLSDCSKKAEIFLEGQGGKIHPIFDTEDKYLQQRSTAPTQNAFK
jgi:hypothetical protein